MAMNKSTIHVIIADDHAIFLEGLQAVLSTEANIDIIAHAKTADELVLLSLQHKPDLLLVDLRLGVQSGIDAWREISQQPNPPKIIIISLFDDEHHVMEAARAGVRGYITKGAKKEDLIEAIYAVNNNELYYCPRATARLIERLVQNHDEPPDEFVPEFTPDELEIIGLMCEGKSSKEIGILLCKGKRSVETTRRIILKKTNLKTPAEVIGFAYRTGLYKQSPHHRRIST